MIEGRRTKKKKEGEEEDGRGMKAAEDDALDNIFDELITIRIQNDASCQSWLLNVEASFQQAELGSMQGDRWNCLCESVVLEKLTLQLYKSRLSSKAISISNASDVVERIQLQLFTNPTSSSQSFLTAQAPLRALEMA